MSNSKSECHLEKLNDPSCDNISEQIAEAIEDNSDNFSNLANYDSYSDEM